MGWYITSAYEYKMDIEWRIMRGVLINSVIKTEITFGLFISQGDRVCVYDNRQKSNAIVI